MRKVSLKSEHSSLLQVDLLLTASTLGCVASQIYKT